MNELWNKTRYIVQNFTNSSISIIQWSASVAASFQSPQYFILENCSGLLVQSTAGRPTGPLPNVANTAFDVPNVLQGDSWCSKQISIVETHKFQPMFSCDMPQPFLAGADSRYAAFRAMDPASKSHPELQPDHTSKVDIKFVHIGTMHAPGPRSKTSNWWHDGIEEFQLVSDGHIAAQTNPLVG